MKLPFTRTWRKPKIGPDQHNPVVREATARSSGESGHYMPMRFKNCRFLQILPGVAFDKLSPCPGGLGQMFISPYIYLYQRLSNCISCDAKFDLQGRRRVFT